MTKSARSKLADNLKKLRGERGKSMYQVAKELPLSYGYYHALEEGDTCTHPKNPTMEMLDRLADYYQVDVHKLFL